MQLENEVIKNEKKENKKVKKFWGNFFDFFSKGIIGVAVFMVLGFIYFKGSIFIKIDKIEDNVINEIKAMENVLADKKDLKGEIKIVNGFDIEKNTLPFSNFASTLSPGGNCEGYNMFELLYFEGRLSDFLGENMKTTYKGNLSDIELFKEDTDLVYSFREDKNYHPDYVNFTGSFIENDYEKILKTSYDIFDNDKEEGKVENFEGKEFKNNKFKEIIDDITYLHNNKGYSRYDSLPYKSSNPLSDLEKTTTYSLSDISFITENIDNNKLVVLSLSNRISGHSLLAYGYEKIDDDNIKIYVKDSNFTLINGKDLTENEKKVNSEIKNNFYVLFSKDILKDSWSYIYEPNILGNRYYGHFNSFVPGTILGVTRP